MGADRIARLHALIEHPRTGADERATAQRMLDRILAKSAVTGRRSSRVGRHAGAAHIADMIRADIAFARLVATAEPGSVAVRDPIADAPESMTFHVETPHDAGIVVPASRAFSGPVSPPTTPLPILR